MHFQCSRAKQLFYIGDDKERFLFPQWSGFEVFSVCMGAAEYTLCKHSKAFQIHGATTKRKNRNENGNKALGRGYIYFFPGAHMRLPCIPNIYDISFDVAFEIARAIGVRIGMPAGGWMIEIGCSLYYKKQKENDVEKKK